MTTLNFEKVTVKNFLSFGAQETEIDLSTGKKYSVIADNGSGKTGLFVDSIFFALFGSTFRPIKKNQIINQINSRDCLVRLELTVDDAVSLKIERGLKPDVFKIIKDGNEVGEDLSIAEKQRLVLDLIKTSKETLSQIIFIGADHQPFLSQTPATRRNFVEAVLDLSIYSAMNSVAKIKLSKLKNEISEISAEINKNDAVANSKKSVVDSIKEKDQKFIDKCQSYIDTAKSKEKQFEDKIDEISSEIKSKKNKIDENLHRIAKIEDYISEVEKYNSLLDEGICPTCDSDISNKEKQLAKEEIEELEDLTEQNEMLKTEKSLLDDKLRKIEEKFAEIKQKSNKAQQAIDLENASAQEDLRENLNSEIEGLVLLTASLQEDVEEIQEKQEQYSLIQKILAKGDAKKIIIDEYIPFFNIRINHYLELMRFSLLLELDSDFNETLRSRYRDLFSYHNFSSGEKARIDAAVLFTWRDVAEKLSSLKTNLLILDEYAAELDSNGKEAMTKMIESFENVTVFTIMPEPQEHMLPDIIKLKKQQNFSVLL